MNTDYYRILGVKENATIEEIKKAYKEKVKQYHPDINHSANSENMIKQINFAYEKIMEEKKKNYENTIENNANTSSDSLFDEYKVSGIDFDINNLDPECIFVGDIYVIKYKPNYDYFAPFEEQTYKYLKSVNVKLLRIGFERYINLSKIKTHAHAEKIKKQLNSYEKSNIIILGDFFKPYAGEQIALNIRPYSNLKKIEKPKKKKIKKLTKIFSASN